MGVDLEVSLGLWQDRPADEVCGTAALADRLGFRSVWIGEMATWDAFALGAHVGARFEQAGLVLGPFPVTVRDPMMIAMGTASVAAITGRPVSVALGTSSTTVVEQWHGRSRARAGQALAESAQAVRALLDGEKAAVAGDVVRTAGYRLRLTPPRSELVVAAFGDRAIAAAARYADRMVLNLIDPPTAADLIAKLALAAAAIGRPRPRVAIWCACAIDPRPAALEQMRRSVVGYLAAPGYAEMFARAGFADLVAYARTRPHPGDLFARVPPELHEVVGLIGSADTVAERIAAYHAAGVDDVVLVPSATADDPFGEHTLRAAAEIDASLPR